ncbi:MAG TPA: LamG-like jellyroll fold domain-containing protein, partial [Candidatus Marinimicrobia bacterium]|nr:LamG-like jellyroll fold domain-containing protein [Candidatus Neomarinimicrobiota bacterium]
MINNTPADSVEARDSDTTGKSWRATYTVPGDLSSDVTPVNFSITNFNDPAGNINTHDPISGDESAVSQSVKIDVTDPMIMSTTITTDNTLAGTDDYGKLLAKDGDKITLDFTTDENLSSAEVIINGETIEATGSEKSWSATTTNSFMSDESEVSFEITKFTDIVGNENNEPSTTSDSIGSTVRIDVTDPMIMSTTITTDNTLAGTGDDGKLLAKDGDTITLDFTTDEDLSSAEVIINGETIVATGSETSWSATTTNSFMSDESEVSFEVYEFIDLAGNETSEPSATSDNNGNSVRIDATLPRILLTELKSTNSSTNQDLGSDTLLAKKDDKVTLTFTTSERVINPEVQINNFQAETSYLNFDGDDDWIEVSVAKNATDWTFNAWGQLNSFDGWKNIYDQQHSQRITISVSSNKFMLYDTNYRMSDNSFDLEDDSGWHMYTVSQSGNTLSFHVDGQLVNTEPSAGHAIGGVDAHIGRFFPIKFGIIEEWDGGLDQISIWERALNEDEVTVVYNSGYGIDVSQNYGAYQSASELMAYWPLSENSGTMIQDSSNNTNYGLIQNSTWASRAILQLKNIEKITSDASGKNWVAEYQVKGGDVVDGAMEFQITGFQDSAGNSLLSPSILTEDDHQKSVTLDTNNPRVLTTSIASSNTNIDPNLGANTLLAKAGDIITVKFTTDERLKDPTATINGNIVDVTPQADDESGKKWEFEYDVVEGINVD